MFTKVVSVWRSLLRFFSRKTPEDEDKEISQENIEAAMPVTKSAMPVTVVRERSAAMNTGFDMKTEIARLSTRILEPVAAKSAPEDLQPLIEQICRAFEQLTTTHATAQTDFKAMAITILEPIRPRVSEVDFARVIDRLRGAMAEFCRADLAKAKPTAEPSRSPVVATQDAQRSRNEEAQV